MGLQKSIITLSAIAGAIYLAFGLLLFINQQEMLYHPDERSFYECNAFEGFEKINPEDTRAYYRQGESEHIIIHYHGNAGSACDRSYMIPILDVSDASLLFVEYSGYAGDDQKPSEELILDDARHIHRFVQESGYKDITVYGESLGSGPASFHASLGGIDDLILVTPFTSLTDAAQELYPLYPASVLVHERYDNIGWLGDYQGRILIIHGEEDQVISPALSQKLYASIPSDDKEYALIEGKGHNELLLSPLLADTIKEHIRGK
ncbi:MAG: alpha/beta hydrolase [Nanoarchaeota archaeon]